MLNCLKNDNLKCREAFIKLFNEICYPLLHHNSLPEHSLSNHDAIEVILDLNYIKLYFLLDFNPNNVTPNNAFMFKLHNLLKSCKIVMNHKIP